MEGIKKIAIYGVPRSGTSWLGQIFNSSEHVAYRYQPIFSYSFPFSIDKYSNEKDIVKFYKELLVTEDPFVCQNKNISGNKTPKFNKVNITHLVWKEVRYLETMRNLLLNSDTKIVGIVREPCEVIKSWMKAPKEFDKKWDINEEWRYAEKKNITEHDFYGFEKWVEGTNMMLNLRNKFPHKFVILKYEDLLINTINVMEHLFEFCDLPFSNQTKNFIYESTSKSTNDPYDVYRNNKKVDEWKDYLPINVSDKIIKDKRVEKILTSINDNVN